MREKRKQKSVKNIRGMLLALLLSMSMMHGMGMTVEAAEKELDGRNDLVVGETFQGGDVIKTIFVPGTELEVYIDGRLYPGSLVETGNQLYMECVLPTGMNYEVTAYWIEYGGAEVVYKVCLESDVPAGGSTNLSPTVAPTEEHLHFFSWITTQEAGVGQDGVEEYRCACGLVEDRNTIPGSQAVASEFKDMLREALSGEQISFDSGRWYTLNDSIIEKLAERNDVSAEITFVYQGKSYRMTIPAGADYSVIFADEENFYGYFYFARLIGAVIEEL